MDTLSVVSLVNSSNQTVTGTIKILCFVGIVEVRIETIISFVYCRNMRSNILLIDLRTKRKSLWILYFCSTSTFQYIFRLVTRTFLYCNLTRSKIILCDVFIYANRRTFPSFLGNSSLKLLFTFKRTQTEVQRTFTFQRYAEYKHW